MTEKQKQTNIEKFTINRIKIQIGFNAFQSERFMYVTFKTTES